MSDRLQYLSKDKEMRIQQLHLLIHNCNVYRIKDEIRQVMALLEGKIEKFECECVVTD